MFNALDLVALLKSTSQVFWAEPFQEMLSTTAGMATTAGAFSTIYSNSIGEGELGVVPIQMANLAATIANRGYYYLPHLVQSVGDSGRALKPYTEKQQSGVDPQHFEPIVQAMSKVVNETGGTARRAPNGFD